MKIIDSSVYPLQSDQSVYHLATLVDGVREYVAFLLDNKVYIEEITGGNLKYIDDDDIAKEAEELLLDAGILHPMNIAAKIKRWEDTQRKN